MNMKSSVSLGLQLKAVTECPLCGYKERLPLYNLEQTTVFKCSFCGLSYLDPCLDSASMATAYESSETLKELNPFHEGYYEYGDLNQDSKTLQDFKKSLELLEKHLPSPKKKILEVGFGNGLFLALARSRGWEVEGIDTSERNVDLAREKFSLNLQCGFFEAMKTDQKFDAVAMLDVIEHIERPPLFLQKAYTLLNPGGLLLLSTPNEASFLHGLSRGLYRLSAGLFSMGIKKMYLLEHVTYYNLKTLTNLVWRSNFDPVEHYHTSTDLSRYRLKPLEGLIASAILSLGKLLGQENRVVLIARKRS